MECGCVGSVEAHQVDVDVAFHAEMKELSKQ
jgi:hypothetical protein